MQIGKKYLYLTEEAYIAFELLQYIEKSIAARKIQKYWWKYKERRYKAAVKIQRCKFCFNFVNFVFLSFFYLVYRKIYIRRKQSNIENFIDLSKKSSEIFISRDDSLGREFCDSFYLNSYKKAEEYLRANQFNRNYEGEQLSLTLEKHFNSLRTKPFKRVLFYGDHIISYNRLAEVIFL